MTLVPLQTPGPEGPTDVDGAPPEAPGAPAASRRRTFVMEVAGLAIAGALPSVVQAQARPSAGSADDGAFLRFSMAITGHADLDPTTAARIRSAMTAVGADAARQIQELGRLATGSDASQALLEKAAAAGLRDTALAVVAAWYTGTVGSGPDGVVVAYRDALMYRPVADAQTAPTYCSDGPAWWTRDPPAVGVAAPVERSTATPPPTTGFPVPTTGTPAPPRSTPQPRR